MKTIPAASRGPEGGESRRPRVLFVCTGNSCRSQMAEGWARTLCSDRIEAFSAGIAPGGLDPHAAAVLREAGVDTSTLRAKHLDEVRHLTFDRVVTLSERARAACSSIACAGTLVHAPFPAPRLARHEHSPHERLDPYRRVRDGIRDLVLTLLR